MNGLDLAVALVLLVASGATVVINVVVASRVVSHVPGSWLRSALWMSALLALIYHIAYWWLLIAPSPDWSRFMRPVGILAWTFGPWMALPLAVRTNSLKLADYMRQQAREVLPEISDVAGPKGE